MSDFNKPTNPPAFPRHMTIYGQNVQSQSEAYGMDLRDYFAAKAMQAFITLHEQALTRDGEPCHWEKDGTSSEIISEQAYGVADAMLKAREAE
jgi:hypothetical protein